MNCRTVLKNLIIIISVLFFILIESIPVLSDCGEYKSTGNPIPCDANSINDALRRGETGLDWSQVKDFHGWLDLIFNYYRQKTGKSIIGVKIANNLHRVKNTIANMRMIQTVLPDAYCLQIVRDPCDIFLSFRKIFCRPPVIDQHHT